MLPKMSVLQLGMEIQDAFGMILLLETLFAMVTQSIFAEAIIDAIRSTIDAEYDNPWWTWPFLLAITAKFILFFALVWFAFICKGLSSLLRIWVILESILDLSILLLIIVINALDSSVDGYTFLGVILWLLYTIIFLSIRFYIYAVSWMALLAVEEDSARGLRGYGQGLRQLFLQYKGEFQRVCVILLTLELVWNCWTIVTIDIPLELLFHLAIGDSYLYRPLIAFRIPRIVFTSLVLYVVRKKKTVYLKYSWLPFLVLSIGLGIFLPVFVYLGWSKSRIELFIEPAYFTEITLSIFLNAALVYNILGLAAVKPRIPVPFAPIDK